jgi:hypothetical protein
MYDIDHSHELKESKSSSFLVNDVVYLELATMWHDGCFSMNTYDEIL